jgi:predicted ATPase
MLVGTYRDDEVALSGHPLGALKQNLRSRHLCHEIALGRLSEAQVVDYLVAEQQESPLPGGLAALVSRHSEGNPLFMVATLDHLIERGLIARDRGGWRLRRPLDEIGLAVPESLREMIEIQIERLSPDEQRVLEGASLTQHRAFSVIARTAAAMDTDPGQFERVCERLSRRTHILHPGILEELPDGTISPFYEFAHALYREVLYNRIPPGRRARLHRQAAEWAEAAFAEQPSEAAPFLPITSSAAATLRGPSGTSGSRPIRPGGDTRRARSPLICDTRSTCSPSFRTPNGPRTTSPSWSNWRRCMWSPSTRWPSKHMKRSPRELPPVA